MTHTQPSTDIGRADRTAIWIILVAGFFGGGFIAALGLITALFRLLDPSRYPVGLLADIPIEGGQGIVQAHGDSVVVNADTLSAGILWTLAASDAIGAITIACVTASFAYVLFRVAQRQPFHRTMQTAALVAGCATALGGLLFQGVHGLGQMMAAHELNPALGGVLVAGFTFDPLVPIVGLGILALVYVFRVGARLQRDTEGLV